MVFWKRKGHSFQRSHSDFEILFCIGKNEYGMFFCLSFLKNFICELFSSHFYALVIFQSVRMVVCPKYKAAMV